MKKKERIKQLESELQEWKHNAGLLKDCVYPLEAVKAVTEPYFPKLSKMEAFDMIIRLLHTQPNSPATLESVLPAVDTIMEWYNKDNSSSPVDNDFKVWEELLISLSFKFEQLPDNKIQFQPAQIFNEFKENKIEIPFPQRVVHLKNQN